MRILLAEDQAMVRGALASLLRLSSPHELVEAADGDAAFKLLKAESFDVLLTDIEMPGRSGLDLAAWLQQQQSRTKVIVITTFGRSGYVRRALDCGVSGFLLKDAPVDDLLAAIDKVLAGKRVIDSELALLALGEQDPLSDKERRALRLAGEGRSTAEIAALLFIAEGTVRNYLSEAMAKLNAVNRVDAARIAQQKAGSEQRAAAAQIQDTR